LQINCFHYIWLNFHLVERKKKHYHCAQVVCFFPLKGFRLLVKAMVICFMLKFYNFFVFHSTFGKSVILLNKFCLAPFCDKYVQTYCKMVFFPMKWWYWSAKLVLSGGQDLFFTQLSATQNDSHQFHIKFLTAQKLLLDSFRIAGYKYGHTLWIFNCFCFHWRSIFKKKYLLVDGQSL